MTATPPRLLVLGRLPLVMETVLGELSSLGLAAQGSIRPETAASEFDPAAFDLLAIGGGIEAPLRASLKEEFAARHPGILLVDATVPRAVQQIVDALDGRPAIAPVDLDAYAMRIGFDGAYAPTLGVLKALHERHPDRIVFEAVDALLGRGIELAPEAVDAKLIGRRRGGYCFEQNGLFRRVLAASGFDVEGLCARVRWLAPAGMPARPRTHMVLRVTMDGVPWLADVGFGSVALTEPLRLDTDAPQETRHDTFRIFDYGRELLLQVRRDGAWLPVYEISREVQTDGDYEAANWFTSTHPRSPFRNALTVARTAPEARYGLLNNRLAIRRPGAEPERRILDAGGIEAALSEVFGLPVEPEWRPVIERAAASPTG